jgi:hypothetical protein
MKNQENRADVDIFQEYDPEKNHTGTLKLNTTKSQIAKFLRRERIAHRARVGLFSRNLLVKWE